MAIADKTAEPIPSLAGCRGTIMVQGTTSDAGKSTVVAALCRLLHRQGVRVVPFKPQNMALNSAVTIDGGEIGRAQALQAQAAGLAPHTDMNPILLKPNTDAMAQVIVHGKARSTMDAKVYHEYKSVALPAVMESYERLRQQYDVIVVEGAGSPAEVNLRENDVANMGFAVAARCPVILVADIDRGGVFAHFVGTLECLSPLERDLVTGFVINRFRGDISLLEPGIEWLEARTGKPVCGVLPYFHGLHLDAEDAIQTEQVARASGVHLKVIAPVLPRISNHTDFDVLRSHPQVQFSFVGPGTAIPPADLIILPGSKSVQADLHWLLQHGWDEEIRRHLRYGGKLIGICGGMQMLGTRLHDPLGQEGPPCSIPGLGLLDFETTLHEQKFLRGVEGRLLVRSSVESGARVTGYEIHMGTTQGPAMERPALDLAGRHEGALSGDGRILATYVHGLFDQPESCAALLEWAGLARPERVDYQSLREQSIDRIADSLAANTRLLALLADLLQPGREREAFCIRRGRRSS